MKLHLGCGDRIIPGYVNIDARGGVGVDEVLELDDLLFTYEGSKIEVIYACHVLEHLEDPKSFLVDCHSILEDGGTLRLAVPDFEQVCNRYIAERDVLEIEGFILGGQDHELNYHRSIWDYKRMCTLLLEVGFKNVVRYDWRSTEHFYIDDYSQCYLPHMDKGSGILMSLNVEAVK